MATFRVGVGSFNIKDGAVGIGTESSGFGNLKVEGTVKSDQFDVIESGVSTFTRYSGFSANKVEIKNKNTTLSGENQVIGNVIIDNSTLTVGLGSTASIDKIGYVCVKHHFSVPTGDTNFRNEVSGYSEGTIRYNTDLGTMEFFNGNEWRQFTFITDIENSPSGRGRAVISSGYGPSPYPQKYDYVNIMNLGNSLDFGRMQSALRDKQGCGSRIRGLFGAGLSPSNSNEIEHLTFASKGDAIDFGNLTAANGHNAALSSTTRGIWAGGYAPSFTNTMEYVEINTLGDATNFGDLVVASGYLAGGISNGVRGIFAGGTNPNAPASVVRTADFFKISSLGNAVLFGDLTAKHQRPSGTSNSVTGIVFSGRDDMPSITRITMASTGSAENFGQLSEGRYSGFSASNQVRALHGGGSGLSSTNTNTIEFVTIATFGSVEDFGDLSYKNSFVSATSDSHGGLGGY
tara:strand:+ start:10 stop:1389 length:1380 start_codon:yes stop_codon:yes gene_type:complete